MATLKGDRTGHLVAMNPNKASPGEELYSDIPKLKMDSCLVPGSLHLCFEFKISNTKCAFMNNLAALLQKRLQIRLAGETVYDCNDESHYTYMVYIYSIHIVYNICILYIYIYRERERESILTYINHLLREKIWYSVGL